MLPEVLIGLVQIDLEFGNIEVNLSKVLRIIEGHPNTDILVFPELFLTGYDLDNKTELALNLHSSNEIQAICDIALKTKTIVIGTCITQRKQKFSNSLFVINQEGKIVAVYDKVHLIRLFDEHKHFQPGKSLEVVTLPLESSNHGFISAGLATCYDLRFPEMFRQLRIMGSNYFMIPAEWPAERIDHWLSLAKARAIENQSYVIAVNRIGSDPNNDFGGQSIAVAPTGEILAQLGDIETIKVIKVSAFDLDSYRLKLPILRDRRPELYQ